jgi:hypothetical protein
MNSISQGFSLANAARILVVGAVCFSGSSLPLQANEKAQEVESKRQDASQSEQSKEAVIERLQVYLPGVQRPHSCASQLAGSVCQARIKRIASLRESSTELAVGKFWLERLDYVAARQHCGLAVQSASGQVAFENESSDFANMEKVAGQITAEGAKCISQSIRGQDEIDADNLKRLLAAIDTNRRAGDLDKAKALYEELRAKYASLPPSSIRARELAASGLERFASLPVDPPWSSLVTKFTNRLTASLPTIAFVFAACLIVIWLLLGMRYFKRFVTHLSSRLGNTTWTVESIQDTEKQGAAGAVMDALCMESNPLLRHPFEPPALLLIPPGFGTVDGIWWSFFGTQRSRFGIEDFPHEAMSRHVFVLSGSFEDVNLKLAGQEVSGLVPLFRNIRRWVRRGFPSVEGAILRLERPGGGVSWAVRLTAIANQAWVQAIGSPDLTVSVHSSSNEQEYVDAIGLAAQRSAFKLFYRLGEPTAHVDMVTAAAAFHQGVILLRRYL